MGDTTTDTINTHDKNYKKTNELPTMNPETLNSATTADESTNYTVAQRSTQKLGSYRTKAGKFSTTIGNILPSLSAKLHHSKKNEKSKENDPYSSSNSSSESNTNIANKTHTSIFNKKVEASTVQGS